MTLALDCVPRRSIAQHPLAIRVAAAVHQAGRVVALGVTLVVADVLTAVVGGHVDQRPTVHRPGGTQ